MLAAFLILILCFYLGNEELNKNRIIYAVILWNVYSFIVVELLSVFHALTRNGLLWVWGSLNVVLLLFIGVFVIRNRIQVWDVNLKRWIKDILKMVIANKLITLTGAIVSLLAFVMVPYNWDSMTYHLPRIAHWAQNQSVAHFATNDVRQIASPVLAEFINVQVYILSGKRDDLQNLLQACSYLLDAWLIYGIAVKIGCEKKFISLSVLLFMTMPSAFGEALNTQVDLFATLWLLIFVYYFIDIYDTDKITANRKTITECLILGICISFGYLAKPSVDIGMAFFLVLLLIKCIRRKDDWKILIKIIMCVIPVVFLPLIPEWVRNYHTFTALGESSVGARQLVGTLRPNYLMVNLIKNFAQNWPNIYLYDSAEWMSKIVMLFAKVLRVNINDESIAEDGMEYRMQKAPTYGHDTAVNPVVVIFATFCFVWCLCHIRKNRKIGDKYTIWTMSLFVMFCGIVRWESFVNRYMLPYLALLCPLIGWQAQMITEKCTWKNLRQSVVPILYFLCITEMISLSRYHQEMWHENASVRPEGFFARNKEIKQEYLDTLDWINKNGYKKIGLKLSGLNYEYPIWYILDGSEVEIEHVLVGNKSVIYENEDSIPDCILGDMNLSGNYDSIVIHGIEYCKAQQFIENKRMAVYLLKTD